MLWTGFCGAMPYWLSAREKDHSDQYFQEKPGIWSSSDNSDNGNCILQWLWIKPAIPGENDTTVFFQSDLWQRNRDCRTPGIQNALFIDPGTAFAGFAFRNNTVMRTKQTGYLALLHVTIESPGFCANTFLFPIILTRIRFSFTVKFSVKICPTFQNPAGPV